VIPVAPVGPVGPVNPCIPVAPVGPVGPVAPIRLVATPIQAPLAAMTGDVPTVRPFLIIKFELVAIYFSSVNFLIVLVKCKYLPN
jgi:hypothetical protein